MFSRLYNRLEMFVLSLEQVMTPYISNLDTYVQFEYSNQNYKLIFKLIYVSHVISLSLQQLHDTITVHCSKQAIFCTGARGTFVSSAIHLRTFAGFVTLLIILGLNSVDLRNHNLLLSTVQPYSCKDGHCSWLIGRYC